MSTSCRSKTGSFRVRLHKQLPGPGAAQRADSPTCSPEHLRPHSLTPQTLHHEDTGQPHRRTSQNQRQIPNRVICVKEEKTESLVKSAVTESGLDRATDGSLDGGEDITRPKLLQCSSDSAQIRVRAPSRKIHNYSSRNDNNKKQQPSPGLSDEGGAKNHSQLPTKQRFGRDVKAKEKLWVGRNVAETHERKLQKELKKLSVQNWPSRDRLVVFSDVFDDVCESSPVFGRILREIKTEYDLYVNHLMDSQSPLHDKFKPSLEDLGRIKEMELVDAEEEVLRLEEEARTALLENKRVKGELQRVPDLSDPDYDDIQNVWDGGTSLSHRDGVQVKRIQVSNMWREIQQLEEEMKDNKLVSTLTITATEDHIRQLQTERVRLIASNHRLRASNEKLEGKINAVLNREKASKAVRRVLWGEIQSNLQTKRQ